jgi:hypothetical protein
MCTSAVPGTPLTASRTFWASACAWESVPFSIWTSMGDEAP